MTNNEPDWGPRAEPDRRGSSPVKTIHVAKGELLMIHTSFFGADAATPAASLPSASTQLCWYDVQRQRLRKFARDFARTPPLPVAVLTSQGETDIADDAVVATRAGFTQLRRDLPVIDQYFEYSGDADALAKVRELCLAWVRTNQPDGKPINESNLEWLIRVLKRRRGDFSASELADVEGWMAALRAAKQAFAFETNPDEGVVTHGNWYTHHYKILLMVHDFFGDEAAGNALLAEIDGFAPRNFPFGNAAVTHPLSHAIVGTNSDARRIDVPGDHTARFVPGLGFAVTGSSAGNDGDYTVASSAYLSISDTTRIVAVEPVPADGGGGTLSECFSDAVHDMPRAAVHAGESIDFVRRDALHYQVYDLAPWLEIALLTGARYATVIENAWAFFLDRLLSPTIHFEFAASTDSFDAARWQASHPEYLAPEAMFKPQRAAGMVLGYLHWRKQCDAGFVEDSRHVALCLRAVPEIASFWAQYFRWALGYGANA